MRSVFSSAAKRTTSRSRIALHISASGSRENARHEKCNRDLPSQERIRRFFYGQSKQNHRRSLPHHHKSRISGTDGQASALVDRTVFVAHGCEWNLRISLIAA